MAIRDLHAGRQEAAIDNYIAIQNNLFLICQLL